LGKQSNQQLFTATFFLECVGLSDAQNVLSPFVSTILWHCLDLVCLCPLPYHVYLPQMQTTITPAVLFSTKNSGGGFALAIFNELTPQKNVG
jgi:hypothetical protein